MRTRTAQISSYDVFLKFVSIKGGVHDVSEVFSKDCLYYWLSTRTNASIKFPFQSFKRVLYAHIRGIDRRKPFTPLVERALLIILRTSDPWKDLAQLFSKTRRKRKFNKKGFHELNPTAETTVIVPPQNLLLRESPHERFFRCLDSFLPQEQREAILKAAKHRGVCLDSPALKYMLSIEPHPEDLRFNPNFLVLGKDSRKFFSSVPKGVITIAKDWSIEHLDPAARYMLSQACKTRHLLELGSCTTSIIFGFTHWLPVFYKEGVCWSRSIVLTPAGHYEVFHNKLEKIGDKALLTFQYATNLYPDVKKLIKPFV